MTNITWFDAVLAAKARSKRDGLDTVYLHNSASVVSDSGVFDLGGLSIHFERSGWRLPTEAEWEFAARAGTNSPYVRGSLADSALARRYAWFQANSRGVAQPVATLASSAWGLHDLAGNVIEWIGDWKGSFPADTKTDFAGSQSPGDLGDIPVKGGAFKFGLSALRPSSRSSTYSCSRASRASYVGSRRHGSSVVSRLRIQWSIQCGGKTLRNPRDRFPFRQCWSDPEAHPGTARRATVGPLGMVQRLALGRRFGNLLTPLPGLGWGQPDCAPPPTEDMTSEPFVSNWQNLLRAIDALEFRRIHLVLVNFPQNPGYKNLPLCSGTWEPNWKTLRTLQQRLRVLESKHPYFHFHDANKDGLHSFAPEHFVDASHLSESGARVMTMQVDIVFQAIRTLP